MLLTQQLVNVAENRRTDRAIRAVLYEQLRDDPSISVMDVDHDDAHGELEVLASVKSARVLSPKVVHEIEERLVERLGRKVSLFFRCTITKDVGAAGSANLLARPGLDGGFHPADESSIARLVQVAEQVIRDLLVNRPDIILDDVSSVRLPVGVVVVATIQTSHRPVPSQVKRVEALIQEQLGRSDVTLLVRSVDTTATTGKGRVLLGEAHFSQPSPEDQRLADRLDGMLRRYLEHGGDLFVTAVDAQKDATGWTVRAEVVGSRVPTPDHVKQVEAVLARESGSAIELSLLSRTEVVVSSTRYDSVDRLIEAQALKRNEETTRSESAR